MQDAFREHCLRGPCLWPLGSQVDPSWWGGQAPQACPLAQELPTAPVAGGALLREALSAHMVYYPKPMHTHGAFAGTDSAKADCPVTELLCKTVLSLPLDSYKTKEEIEMVVSELKRAL